MKIKAKYKYKNFSGVTLTELLIIISIVGILSSIVIVNLVGARQKAKDNSVLQTMTSTAAIAYRCFSKFSVDDDPRLNSFNVGASSLCRANGVNQDPEFPAWPSLAASTGWDSNYFAWCSPTYSFSYTNAPGNCEAYSDGTCGGKKDTKQFCYMICNKACASADKFVWCTDNGCHKQGF